ncbi:MAG: aspartate 1-decarboxylase [Halanaerobiaceae bacterium]
MLRQMLKSKLHCARVTDADLNYQGSITIDRDIMDKADLFPNERVQIVNKNNGARFSTYVIPGERGNKDICLNGAAARLVQPDDEIIIMSYVMLDRDELRDWKPLLVFFDENNNIIDDL